MYTFNFAYVGSRATGNDGGNYLLAGPNWKGETPPGIKSVIRAETEFAFVLYRTQLFNPTDIDNVQKIQGGYKVQTLSQFLGQPAPEAPSAIDFIKPLTSAAERNSPDRMSGAVLGIYGNSKAEAIYPAYFVDDAKRPLSGTRDYQLRFAPGQLSPVNAFWSLTLYELPSSLLSANPLNRYLINSPMLPSLNRDPDGGKTLYLQHASPGTGKEANWLPSPSGPFFTVMRLYWPRPEALNGKWKAPPLGQVTAVQAPTLTGPVPVTPDDFPRAESDLYFGNIVKTKVSVSSSTAGNRRPSTTRLLSGSIAIRSTRQQSSTWMLALSQSRCPMPASGSCRCKSSTRTSIPPRLTTAVEATLLPRKRSERA
jgi:hypothetical protein